MTATRAERPMSATTKAAADALIAEMQKENARLRDALEWIAQTIHQAHHDGRIESCGRNTCMGARAAMFARAAIANAEGKP